MPLIAQGEEEGAMFDMEHLERLAAAAAKAMGVAEEMARMVYDAMKAEADKIGAELGEYSHQEYPKWVDGKIVNGPEPAAPAVVEPPDMANPPPDIAPAHPDMPIEQPDMMGTQAGDGEPANALLG